MALIALGINHKSAHVSLREKVAFAPEQMAEALQDASTEADLGEVVILSTCNRTEMFVFMEHESEQDITRCENRTLDWLGSYHHLDLSELKDCYYSYREEHALRHMMQVASGLDSMVLGEPQILGQMKSAYAVAQEANTVASKFSRIFPHVFSVAKKVRTDTAIGENPVSVAYAAVNLSKHIFADLTATKALLIGAGETIELVARHLFESGVKKIVVANRTLSRARELAQRFGADAVLLSEIPEQLIHSDIVISSTGSQLPILGKGAVEHALKMRKHRPILMVDIAVPRDIEEQVGELSDVYLYSVDDLTEIVDENMRNRESEARKADKLIDHGIHLYQQQLRSLDSVETLKSYRSNGEAIRDIELEKALKLLAKGDSPEEVMATLARNMANKFMHKPTIEMKKASADGREELISWANDLFGLSSQEDHEN